MTRNVYKSAITLSILATLTGFSNTGCSAADPTKAQPVQPSIPVVSAAEAGEDTDAVEDITQQVPLTDADSEYNTIEDIEFADASFAVDERQLVLDIPTDAELTYEGVVLPRIIPGLVVGMPYEQARMLILADGWRPADGLEPASRNGMDDYMEIEDCSGSGLGLCSMSFVDAEMNRFGLTTWGSEPTVRDWGDVSEAVNTAPNTPSQVAQPSAASDNKNNPPASVKQHKISADSNGDFSSALLVGHRGVYGNNQWLVMPQSDGYLNCRYTPNGEIRSEVVPSMIITAKFNGPLSTDNRQTPNPAADAIVFHEGKPWLRVAGTDRASFFPPSANRSSQDYLGECYVRANSQYITDVSNDAAN